MILIRAHIREQLDLIAQTIGRKSQDTRSGKENKKTGISRGCLESYGFRARAPKVNTVQVSTLEAEVEPSDYSGTYVSTVP